MSPFEGRRLFAKSAPQNATICNKLLILLTNTLPYGTFMFWFLEKSIQKGRNVAAAKGRIKAIAYLRTSSAANVGADKDSDKRQRAAITAYARANGFEIVDEFYDAAVSGRDPVAQRPGFAAMLERIAGNGVRTVLIESPDRFARDLAIQLAGHDFLKSLDVTLIPTTAPDFFLEDTPTAVLVRQVLGAIAEFEKASTVAKLKAARERKRATGVKVEGRKSHAERTPDLVALARRLRRKDRQGNRRSLRDIAAELAAQGHVSNAGTALSPSIVRSLISR
ncbi:recombinase family protein [Rhizobium leguminosarum]|uniref:recombinase family protein n=2 Tax=Rhizobium leguminosarum TaxID=384 RepID=UPI001FE1E92D|nr:recombinase family protein [Rhizobium leguminosarum]